MFTIVNVIAPVFALMAIGYLAVRWRVFPKEGVRGLVAFVNNFGTPCLLFTAMVNSDFSSIFNWSVIVPFYIGSVTCMVLGVVIAMRLFKARPGEAVSSGFTAMFANTVLVGIPIMSRAYGEAALPTTFSIIAFHAPLLITLGMITMELMRRDGQPIHRAMISASIRVVQNPLLWGILLGVLVNHFDIPIAEPVNAVILMMSAAVVPSALFGLGGALNDYRLADNWLQALLISFVRLVIHPAMAWVIMVPVLKLDSELAKYAVLLAAMPAGINVYVFATYYNRGVNVATNTVLISTVLSAFTLTAWLLFLGH